VEDREKGCGEDDDEDDDWDEGEGEGDVCFSVFSGLLSAMMGLSFSFIFKHCSNVVLTAFAF
jgi:hypothetical protein